MLLSYIQTHCRGEANAQTAHQIARALGMEGRHADRTIRKQIKALVEGEPPALIAGLPGKGKGFFVPATEEESDHYENILLRLQKEAACRLQCFRRARREQAGQGELW